MLVLALLLALAPAAADARSCSARNSKTLRSGKLVRVYSVPARYEDGDPLDIHACYRPTGRRAVMLGELGGDDTERLIRGTLKVNGPYVAWAYEWESISSFGIEIKRADLRIAGPDRERMRRLSSQRSGAGGGSPGDEWFAPSSLLLTRRGSVAWMASASDPARPPPRTCRKRDCEVHRYTRRSGLVVLDQGENLDPRSLRRKGPRLRWSKGGQPRSAAFP